MVENKTTSRKPVYLCEAEVTPGLEFVTEAELMKLPRAQIETSGKGEIRFRFPGSLQILLNLRTVQSISLLQHFAVPRPRGLLDNTNIRLFLQQIETARQQTPKAKFETFYLAAAGSDSSIMQRIKAEITKATGLIASDNKGDLWIRIRPGRAGGWETLVRLSSRPLVTRTWRVCNMEGAINAATAHAMIALTQPQPEDIFINLGCGSGTLLIERRGYGRAQNVFGIDRDSSALHCAQRNLAASGFNEEIDLLLGDMTEVPLASQSVSALCADLPFGQLVGSHQENARLYPAMLAEAARIARTNANFVLISHEIRLLERTLTTQNAWSVEQSIPVNLRGLHPRIYVLTRK